MFVDQGEEMEENSEPLKVNSNKEAVNGSEVNQLD